MVIVNILRYHRGLYDNQGLRNIDADSFKNPSNKNGSGSFSRVTKTFMKLFWIVYFSEKHLVLISCDQWSCNFKIVCKEIQRISSRDMGIPYNLETISVAANFSKLERTNKDLEEAGGMVDLPE